MPQVRPPYLRLIVQFQFAVVQAAAQVPEQRQRGGGTAGNTGGVGLHPGAALLGQVHRHIGALNEQVSPGRVAGVERDADARLDLDRHPLDLDRPGQRGPQPHGYLTGRAAGPDGGQQHRELVSAQAGHQVAGPDAVREAVRDDLERPVASRVPEDVVDQLEAIQVEQQEPGPAARACGLGHRLAGLRVQEGTVGQAGRW